MTTHYIDKAQGMVGGTWLPACSAPKGTCSYDPLGVTCPECKSILFLSDLRLDMVPLADLVTNLQDQGMDREAEDLAGAVALMSGCTIEEILDLIDTVAHRRHGATVKFVRAPF